MILWKNPNKLSTNHSSLPENRKERMSRYQDIKPSKSSFLKEIQVILIYRQ